MTQTEITNKITKNILDYFERIGYCAFRINTQSIRGRRSRNKGAADIRAVYKGFSIDIEVKSEKDGLNPDQEKFKEKILNSGGQYWEIRTFDEFINYFEYFKKRIK